MRKETYEINFNFTFNSARKGAKYTLDGERWMNAGEFAEIATKSVLGYKAVKEPNTDYTKASDIAEMRASIKSSKFTLTNMVLADTFEKSLNVYFESTHSKMFIYTVIIEDTVTLYFMDAFEFRLFLETFSKLNERGVVRGKTTSGKMIQWLENLAE